MQSEIPFHQVTMIRLTTNTVRFSTSKCLMLVNLLFCIFAGRFDASALHIAHALKQTEIQKSYNKAREKPIDEYLVSFFSADCSFTFLIDCGS